MNGKNEIAFYRWVLLGGTWLIYVCFGLVTVSMAPLISEISAELGISNGVMGAILGAWPLVYILSAIPCGMLLDRLQAREALFLGLVMIALSAFLRGIATNELTLFVAVGVFGIGGPLVSVGAPKFVSRWFHGPTRGFAIGFTTTGPVFGIAASYLVTPMLLMPLYEDNWRHVMFAFAGFSMSAGVIWWIIASHQSARHVVGSAAEQTRFSIKLLLEIITNPAVVIVVLFGGGIFFLNHGIINWLPEILRAKGLSAEQSGQWASAATIAGIAGLLVVPRLAIPNRRVPILLIIFSLLLTTAIMLLSTSPALLLTALFVFNIARSAVTGVVLLLLMETKGVDPGNHGLLGGIFFVGAEVGGTLGPLFIGLLSSSSGSFDLALIALAGVCAALAALTLVYARISKTV